MSIDPRSNPPQPQVNPVIRLQDAARKKISEVLRRNTLSRTNYSQPDDTCDCDDFVTNPPNPPTVPRRRRPPKPPRPPRPPVLPPPLPPPPVRFDAPQLPNPIPPIIAPPPAVFPQPTIGDGGETGTTEPPFTTEPPSTTEPPVTDGGGGGQGSGGIWEDAPCCGNSTNSTLSISDREMAIRAEEGTMSGDLGIGRCYSMCKNVPILQVRNAGGKGISWCDPEYRITICVTCGRRNVPSAPCYEGNGQISPPGSNISLVSTLKKRPLPLQYNSMEEYYAAELEVDT